MADPERNNRKWVPEELTRVKLSRLDNLIDQYQRYKRPEDLREAAQNIAVEATEERWDMYAIIHAIATLSAGRKQGIEGLQIIADYFDDNELTFKCLIPIYKPENYYRLVNQDLSSAERNLNEFDRRYQMDPNLRRKIESILRQTSNYWSRYPGEHRLVTAVSPFAFTFNEKIIQHFSRSDIGEYYAEILRMTSVRQPEDDGPQTEEEAYYLQVVDTIYAMQVTDEYCKKHRLPAILNLYERPFEGKNFKALHDESLNSADIQEVKDFTRNVNEFLSALPKGDYLWSRITDALFLYSLSGMAVSEDRGSLMRVDEFQWFQKLSVWQQQIADQLLTPRICHFLNCNPPEWFDEMNITRVMKQIIGSNDVKAGRVLSLAAWRGITIRSALENRTGFTQLSEQSALYSVGQMAVGLMDEDEMIHGAFERVKHVLFPQLNLDLYALGDREGVVARMLNVMVEETHLRDITSQTFLDWAKRTFGNTLLRELEQKHEEIQYVIRDILAGAHTIHPSRWGEEISNVEVEMSKNSLSRMLGIRLSLWEFPSSQLDDIRFVLLSDNPDLAISGFINLHTHELELRYLELSPEYKHLENAMKLIAASTLHDILGRNPREWRISRSSNDLDVTQKANAEYHRRKKWLPKNWFRVSSEQLINDYRKGISRSANEAVGTKPPSYVSAHIRRVPYGAVIEAQIHKYNDPSTSEDEKDRLLKEIRDLRDGTDVYGRRLGQPDMEKIINLPIAFQQEVSPILDPDNKLLYTRTFIAPHFSPKLTNSDYATFRRLYSTSYLTHGSALTFLDLAFGELTGMERSTADRE